MRVAAGGVFLAGTAFILTGAHAAGFAINDKSVSARGTGFAGLTTLAEDASTISGNPAGMMQLDGRRLSVGLLRTATTATFADSGSNTSGTGGNSASVTANIPTFYYMDELGPDVRAGFGINSPFGLGLKYDHDWLGRYHAIDTPAHTVNFSPSLAWRVTPALSLGASLDAQYLEATMTKAVDFRTLCLGAGGGPACSGVADGMNRLHGDNWSWGYSLGLAYAFSATTRVGAVLHSGVHHRVAGRSTFDGVPPLPGFPAKFSDSAGGVTVNLPASASIGAAWEASERLTLVADYTWTGWSSYREQRVQFDNGLPDAVIDQRWHDASRYALGARYRLNSSWLARAGFTYDGTPVPDAQHRSPSVPDTDRRWYNLGARWEVAPDFSVDFALAWMAVKDIPIRNREPTTGHSLVGTYEVSSMVAGVQGNWRF